MQLHRCKHQAMPTSRHGAESKRFNK